ncbi:hypothetical protein GQ473_04800 [archaeon]|nr:hypothetical protein [archaeon]
MPKTTTSIIFMILFWLTLVPNTNLELAVGFLTAIIIALISKDFLFYESPKKLLNPINCIYFTKYIIIFLIEEIKSNIQTFALILTGNINPAIIKIPTKTMNDTQKTLLANSITLTPGTFTLEIKDDIYVHYLIFKKKMHGIIFEKNIKKMRL